MTRFTLSTSMPLPKQVSSNEKSWIIGFETIIIIDSFLLFQDRMDANGGLKSFLFNNSVSFLALSTLFMKIIAWLKASESSKWVNF